MKIKCQKEPKKSILKNRSSLLYIAPEKTKIRESKIGEKIDDIDGKMISHNTLTSTKEVEFRKSICAEEIKELVPPKPPKKTGQRKSCLKRGSILSNNQILIETEKPTGRVSKLDGLSTLSIDGKLIPKSNSKKSRF